MKPRLAVVGAGAGGMAAALLAQRHGLETDLYEAHSLPGGCAGWFRRGEFSFDVGATTLSGVGIGKPLTLWQELTGSPLNLVSVDPGIVFHLNDEIFFRYRDSEHFLSELHRVFPGIDHQRFWRDIESLSTKAWASLAGLKGFPPRDFGDTVHLLGWMKSIGLLPSLLQSLTSYRRMRQGDSAKLKRWLDALCLISAQNHTDQIPALIGALALSYPAETYAPIGGMEGLFKGWLGHFQQSGGQWFPRHEIKNIQKNEQWILAEKKYSHVVCNLTGWGMSELLKDVRELPKESWGAFTVYAGVKLKCSQENPYHLVLNDDCGDYFASFSMACDRARAPEGWQTVTISQHCLPEDWVLDENTYEERKKMMLEKIWKDFCDRFEVVDGRFLTAGTPRTFQRYTHRPLGRVGGLPHRWAYPLWRWPRGELRAGLSQISDTTFPGQGIVAVVARALRWWEDLAFQSNL